MKKILLIAGVILLIGCGASRENVKPALEDKPAIARFDSEIIYNSADKEIIELQSAYSDKNWSWMVMKLRGYFSVGNSSFVQDVISDSPGMLLRLLAIPVLYHDDVLFEQIYSVGFASESDEASRRMSVAFKKAYKECGVSFQQALRSYFVNRKIEDIDWDSIGDRNNCRNVVKQVF